MRPLNSALLPQDPLDLFDVVSDSCLLVAQSIRTILAEQKFEQRLQVVPYLGLIIHGTLQLLLPQTGGKCFHLQPNMLVFAFRQGLFQERGPTGIGPSIEFRHFQHQHLEPSVSSRQRSLLIGEFLERARLVGRLRGAVCRGQFGRLRAARTQQDRKQDGD